MLQLALLNSAFFVSFTTFTITHSTLINTYTWVNTEDISTFDSVHPIKCIAPLTPNGAQTRTEMPDWKYAVPIFENTCCPTNRGLGNTFSVSGKESWRIDVEGPNSDIFVVAACEKEEFMEMQMSSWERKTCPTKATSSKNVAKAAWDTTIKSGLLSKGSWKMPMKTSSVTKDNHEVFGSVDEQPAATFLQPIISWLAPTIANTPKIENGQGSTTIGLLDCTPPLSELYPGETVLAKTDAELKTPFIFTTRRNPWQDVPVEMALADLKSEYQDETGSCLAQGSIFLLAPVCKASDSDLDLSALLEDASMVQDLLSNAPTSNNDIGRSLLAIEQRAPFLLDSRLDKIPEAAKNIRQSGFTLLPGLKFSLRLTAVQIGKWIIDHLVIWLHRLKDTTVFLSPFILCWGIIILVSDSCVDVFRGYRLISKSSIMLRTTFRDSTSIQRTRPFYRYLLEIPRGYKRARK
ncbi:hypothetical protein EDC01DRAFT_636261 [Geopyxis carbonaria]|nr:hypothetical protein EDC01DRAFT_636261 [Geopyxis carbonaria]